MRSTTLLAAFLGVAGRVAGLGQQPVVSFIESDGAFRLAGGSLGAGQILVSGSDHWGVIRAAGDLAADFGRVTGTNYTLSNGQKGASPATYEYHPVNNKNNTYYTTTGTSYFLGPNYTDPSPSDTVIIAGTVGSSDIIDSLVSSKAIDVSAIKGQWESFTSQLVKNPAPGISQALVIAGSDARGTIYGIYDISEQIGVSPWYWWADVSVKQHKDIFVPSGLTKVQKSPSVKYRGFFLNDEQPALSGWVGTNFPDAENGAAGYGPAFYAHVFELLLRLRANYLWPTVWGSMFEVDFPGNQPLIDAYEVVLGSSHTEPMMRAQNEFGNFYKGPWAYNLNNQTIDQYFVYGAERAKPYARNSLWTMGMRGTGDTAIEGLGTSAIVSMLEVLVAHQRNVIGEVLGVNVTTVPQMWCLYKEVQSYIFAGLQVPEDVTLLWADDNWGNVRRLPLKNETNRAGRAGVYYHFDYVGVIRDYKWINTVQLAKTAQQMGMAYSRGADRIWIVNVGDLKPLEIPINHFFDMAYDAEMWNADSVYNWTQAWAAREFGASLAPQISDLMIRYSVYANRVKFEVLEPETYSLLNYNEAEAVLQQWAQLRSDAEAVNAKLDSASQPSFFEMVLHPITAGEIVNRIQIGGAKNMHHAGQKRNAANDVMNAVMAAGKEDAQLQMTWNALLNGKWAHMMDQTHLGYDGYWQQPMRNTLPAMVYVETAFPSLAGHVGVGVEASNATVQGDDQYHANSGNNLAVPPMDPYGPATRYFEVFTRGTKSCDWTAAPWSPYVKLSQYSGTVGPNNGTDTRVFITIDWANAPKAPSSTTVNINITNSCRSLDKYGYPNPMVQVPVINRVVPSTFTQGFVESDGHVSIAGPHYQSIVPPASNASSSGVSLHTFKALSRTGDAVGLVPQNTDKLAADAAPALQYDLYLYTNTTAANVTVMLSPSLNYMGDYTPLEYGIALWPAGQPQPTPKFVRPVGPSIGANLPVGWESAVGTGVWAGPYSTSNFSVPSAGAYTLRVWPLMPSVLVQKIVIDLGGVRPSFLGPPESFLVGRDTVGSFNGTTFLNEPGTLGGYNSTASSGGGKGGCKRRKVK